VASAFCQRHYMEEALVLYRQHSTNTVGARALNAKRTFVWRSGWRAWPANVSGLWQAGVRFVKRLNNQDHASIFKANARQAQAFGQQHVNALTLKQRGLVGLVGLIDRPWAPVQRALYRLVRRL